MYYVNKAHFIRIIRKFDPMADRRGEKPRLSSEETLLRPGNGADKGCSRRVYPAAEAAGNRLLLFLYYPTYCDILLKYNGIQIIVPDVPAVPGSFPSRPVVGRDSFSALTGRRRSGRTIRRQRQARRDRLSLILRKQAPFPVGIVGLARFPAGVFRPCFTPFPNMFFSPFVIDI